MGKHDFADEVKLKQLMRRGEPCLGICAGKHCAKAGTKHVLQAVRAALEEVELGGAVAVTLTKCQDYCDDGPTMTVLPGEYTYVDLQPHSARQVVLDHVRDGRPVLKQLHKRLRRKLERRRERSGE